jgi:hypothetical protein
MDEVRFVDDALESSSDNSKKIDVFGMFHIGYPPMKDILNDKYDRSVYNWSSKSNEP